VGGKEVTTKRARKIEQSNGSRNKKKDFGALEQNSGQRAGERLDTCGKATDPAGKRSMRILGAWIERERAMERAIYCGSDGEKGGGLISRTWERERSNKSGPLGVHLHRSREAKKPSPMTVERRSYRGNRRLLLQNPAAPKPANTPAEHKRSQLSKKNNP